jgi:hypothetical protein
LSRKLFLLNLLLAALLGAAGWHLRRNWEEAEQRQTGFLGRYFPPAPASAVPKFEPVAPLQVASYTEVATKMVFSKDRNPDVVVEEPKPKPVPPFPVAYGVLSFGELTTAFLSEAPGKEQKNYRAGDKVGPFKLASLSRDELVFEWEDKTFKKTLAELKPKTPAPPPAGQAAGPGVTTVELPKNTAVQTSEEKVKEIQKSITRDVGIDVGGAERACAPGDTAPAGTVMNGYRKVVGQTPFSQTCRWVPVR